MMTNFREMLGISKLVDACGVAKEERNAHQKKAIKNIKYCANDQWGYVNSWLDSKDPQARAYMLDAEDLFNTIYSESQTNVYREGYCGFGPGAHEYLKDIRFCGAKFLKQVCLFYTAKLLEESVYEVEGTEGDAQRIYETLAKIKEGLV